MYSIKSSIGLAFGLSGALLIHAPGAVAASAPALSEVKVLKVESPPCGFESIADRQEQTRCDHSGASIKVYVLELGYGREPRVALDGFEVDGSRTRVCAFDNGNLSECSVGVSKVVGYLYIFDLAGQQQGTFTFSNTSINAPGNTLSTRLYIK